MITESVTILFTDIVGSTALSQRLTPEAADAVRRDHFSLRRKVIADTGGTEVKNLGDGIMVAFGSASAAMTCAVGMQQHVEKDNRGRQNPVGLRVGLSGGEVTKEHDDYFGDPVIEASRLCAACESAQILAANVVPMMAGRRSRHQYRSLGDLELKGLPDLIGTVEILWEPFDDAGEVQAVPIPGRLSAGPAVGLVGRHEESRAIRAAYDRVASAAGREVLLVAGEPGQGKTTLVGEAARRAFENGACVLFGHCEEDLATPYQLFGEALGHYVAHATESELRTHVGTYGSELVRLVPAMAGRLDKLPPSKATDPDTERYLLFASVVGLLSTISSGRPVVFVLDDLQWADDGSLLLLRHLCAADRSMRVLVLGTYRDRELPQATALRETLGVLRRQSGVSRIELSGLDSAGVVSFIEASAGHELDEIGVTLARAVYLETDGNPFFVSEILRNLVETGAIRQDTSGRWVARDSSEPLTLPDSLREVIGARVGRLGHQVERILSIAAVIGRDFDLDVLSRTTATSENDLIDTLEQAETVALIGELPHTSGRYSFEHALIQHALYEDLGPTRRARAHLAVAPALEELYADRPGERIGELAYHWSHAPQPANRPTPSPIHGGRAMPLSITWRRRTPSVITTTP